MTRPHPSANNPVAVIGGGQAGLAAAHHLIRAGLEPIVLERADAIGTSWARRWDSLRLFTPARYDALPGMPFPGDPWAHPGKDDVARYLADYATRFDIPVRTGTEVRKVTRDGTRFALHLADGSALAASQLVVATGAFGTPYTPAIADGAARAITQVHSDAYRSPEALPAGDALVVGGGNSGMQIALELAQAGRHTTLAEGTRLRDLPQRILGRDLFWWLTASGLIRAPHDTLIGRRLRASEPVIGTPRRTLRRAGVAFAPRATAIDGRRVLFADGRTLDTNVIVWATGYRHDDTWIRIPELLDARGVLHASDGATRDPLVHTIGRPWQRDRGSALLGYVQRDAERLAARALRAHETAMTANRR